MLKRNNLLILQWNCNGLMAHSNELKQHILASQGKYDVICFQETFLKPARVFTLPGYSTVRRDRSDGAKGGLLTLIKAGINFTELKNQDDIESLGIKINFENSQLNVVNLYLPPGREFNVKSLDKLFDKNTIIIGDLNARHKLWGSSSNDPRGKQIEDLLDAHNFVVINTGQPTYQHYNGQRSHLDIALVSNSLAARSAWTVLNNTMGSDHSPTVVTLNNVYQRHENFGHLPEKFKFDRANWNQFKESCRSAVTVDTVYDDNVDLFYNQLVNGLVTAAEDSIPRSKPNGRKTKHKTLPYWNLKCKNAVKERNVARNKMFAKPTEENCLNYRRLKGVAQRQIKTTAQ